MKCEIAVLVLFSLAPSAQSNLASDTQKSEEAALLLKDLLGALGDFDVSVIHDNDFVGGVFSEALSSSGVAATVEAGQTDTPPSPDCSSLPPRPTRITEAHRRPKLFFVRLSEKAPVSTVLTRFRSSLTLCPTDLRTGDFHPENAFAFVLSTVTQREELFKDEEIRRHAKVVAFLPTGGKNSSSIWEVTRWDFYQAKVVTTAVWKPGSASGISTDLFLPFPMRGRTLRVSNIPYDLHIAADVDPEPVDQRHLYVNQTGYEDTMLRVLCSRRVLDCRVEYTNPEDNIWGGVGPDGEMIGHFSDLVNERVDLVAGAIVLTFNRSLVSRYLLVGGKEGLTFASPLPTPRRSVLAVFRPLTAMVWAAVLLALPVAQGALYGIAVVEEAVVGARLKEWSTPAKAAWYGFGTLLGESITRDTRSEGAWALRWVIGCWISFALILTSAYGSTLRAFFTQPEYTRPMETLEDVVFGTLPWDMVIYGEEVETMLASSAPGSPYRLLWDGKVEMPYSDFPFDRLASVYRGESVMVEWRNMVETAVEAGFTRSNGQRSVHVPGGFVTAAGFLSWTFHPLNPGWEEAFRPWIRRFEESGLLSEWMHRARSLLKDRYQALVLPLPEGQEGAEGGEEGGAARKMSLEDLLGVFVIFGSVMCAASISFALESALGRNRRRGRRPMQGYAWTNMESGRESATTGF